MRKNVCFEKTVKFQNVFGNVGKKFSAGLLKIFATFPEEFYHQKNTSFAETMSFSGLCGFFSYFGYKVSGKTIKTAFQFSRGTCFMKDKTVKKLDLFQLRTLNIFLFEACTIFSASLWKLQSRCPQNLSEGKMFSFLTKCFLFSFSDF